MKILKLILIVSAGFSICKNAFGSSIVSNEEKIWMIGCDNKVYERSNDTDFKPMATKLPSGVLAKDLMFRKVLVGGFPGGVGSGAAKYDEALYIVGSDGNLYVNAPNGNGFELSKTQLPSAAKCEAGKSATSVIPKPAPAVR